MARIRTLKPDLCLDERLADCEIPARLMFVFMQPHCDDGGVHPARPRTLKAEVFPHDESITTRQVVEWMAQLIKAGVGLEVAFAEVGGWDTHTNQSLGNAPGRGQLANLLRDFSNSIAAFATDLGKRMDDVVVLTMSEFGRTARENGSRATDHGHGNATLVLGNSVKGGKVYGDWKGLKPDQLNEGRDLSVTTDFRDVFAEVAVKHLGSRDAATLFPKYSVDRSKFRSFLT